MRINSSSKLPYGYGVGKVNKIERPTMDIHKDREKQNEEKKEQLEKQKAFIEYIREYEVKRMLLDETSKEEKPKYTRRV